MGSPGATEQVPVAVEVIRSFFTALKAAGVTFGVLHGLEGFPQRHGRDIDIYVNPGDSERALETVMDLFRSAGWDAGAHRMAIGLDQVFVRGRDGEGRELWLEFDLIHRHPLCWAGQELVPAGLAAGDLADDAGQPYYAWGWFAKNLMIQLLAGKERKFTGNMKELAGKRGFLPAIRERAASMGLGAAVESIATCADPAGEFRGLRRRVQRQVLLRMLNLSQWPALARGVMPWVKRTWRLHFPKRGCVPKVHVWGGGGADPDAFAAALGKRISEVFPFPAVTVRAGRRVDRGSGGGLARWLDLRRGGWNRQLRDSSWLMLQIETWQAEPDPGDAVTAGDFHFQAGRRELECALDEAVQAVGDAFLSNLWRGTGDAGTGSTARP